MLRVKLKWNKLLFDDLEVNVDEGVPGLKRKIYSLTGVPADRQKLMAKGAWLGTLKDDADLSKSKITPNLQIMLMGSAEVMAEPKEQITFFEDLSSEQKAVTGVTLSAGLHNLGNTCYLNSTVQCLRHMPELRAVLDSIRSSQNPDAVVSKELNDSFKQLDISEGAFTPMTFVTKFRQFFPTFAQRGNSGHYMQQDAEEFFSILVNSLSEGVRTTGGDFKSLLNIDLEETQRCQESDGEPVVVKADRVYKVVCNIQNAVAGSIQIDHMADGIRLALTGTLEKRSSTLGRDALWSKSQKMATLPNYLCVHFMRFFWKATPESRDHQGVKCKILRAVNYPETLDIYEFCTEEIQRKLRANRDLASKKFEEQLKAKQASGGSGVTASIEPVATVSAAVSTNANETAMDVEDEENAALQAALSLSLAGTSAASENGPAAVPAIVTAGESTGSGELVCPGLPVGWTGNYELYSIVTHKGRDADSGHYIGWVRQSPGSEFWWKYDDDKVSEVRTDEIMTLKGGGDKDMAYLVFYRAKN